VVSLVFAQRSLSPLFLSGTLSFGVYIERCF
jgi:hypothetical protein